MKSPDIKTGLTFDDVLLAPAYSGVMPRDVDVRTRLTKEITLNIPLISAAMDCVTEARMAIAIAQEGGIGIIHKNLTIEEQAQQVDRVKKYESVVILKPKTLHPEQRIRDALNSRNEGEINAFTKVYDNSIGSIIVKASLILC